MNDNDKLKELYNNLVQDNYDLPDYETFKRDMSDAAKMQELYDNIKEEYDVPEFDVFRYDMGFYNTRGHNSSMGVDEASNKARQAQQQRNMGTPGYVPNRFGIPTQQGMGPVADAAPHPMTPAQPLSFQERVQKSVGMAHNVGKAKADFSQRMSAIEQGNKPFSSGKAQQYDPTTGETKDVYYTTTGQAVTTPMERDIANIDNSPQGRIGKELEDAYAERDRLEQELSSRSDEVKADGTSIVAKIGAGTLLGLTPAGVLAPELAKQIDKRIDPQWAMLNAAKRANDKRIAILERDRDRDGFFRTVGKTLFNIDTWDFGANEIADAVTLSAAADKKLTGKAGEAQEALMRNTYLKQIAEQRSEDDTFMQRAGDITANAIPFVLEFILTGGGYAAIGAAGRRLGAKAAAKIGAKGFAAWTMKNTGTLAGNMLSGLLMANTTGLGRTAADIMGRHQGVLTQDENGDYVFRDGKSWGRSVYEGEMAQAIEYFTEHLGNSVFDKALGKWVYPTAGKLLTKGLEKLGASKVSEIFSRMSNSQWAAILDKGGIQGYPSEVLEEGASIVLNSLLVGDNQFSDLWDRKTLADILGGMALSIGFMQAPGVARGAYNTAQYYRFKHNTEKSDQEAARVMGEQWEGMRDLIDNTPNEGMQDVIEHILDSPLPDDFKATSVTYAYNLMKLRGYNLRTAANAKDRMADTDENGEPRAMSEEEAAVNEAFANGYEADEQQRSDISIEREDNPNDPQAQAAWDGVQQRITDDAEDKAEAVREAYKPMTREDGTIHPVVLNVEGADGQPKTVYLLDGSDVVLNPDGSIDREKSSPTLTAYDPEQGKPVFIDDPYGDRGIQSVGEVTTPEALEQLAGGGVDGQGALTSQDGQGARIPDALTPQDGQGARAPERTPGAPEAYTPGMVIGVVDNAGQEQTAEIVGRVRYDKGKFVPDENGMFVEYTVEGETKHETADKLNDMVRWHETTAQSQQPNTATEGQAPTAEQTAPQGSPTQTAQQTGAETQPQAEDTRTPAQRTYDDMTAKYGEKASHKVDVTLKDRKATLDTKKKALDKAQTDYDDAPIGKEDKAEKALAKAQEEYDNALAEYNSWDEVRKLRDQALLARAEQEEQQRKAEQERRLAEETEAQRKQREAYEAEQARRKAEAEAAEKRRQEENARLRAEEEERKNNPQPAEPKAPIEGTKGQASQLEIARQELADDPGALAMLEDMSPRTLEEVASKLLSSGKNQVRLIKDDFMRETGYTPEDVKRYPFVFATADKGGVTLSRFGEMVAAEARNNGIPFDENDPMAGVTAALNMLGGVGSQGDINGYVAGSRIQQAYDYHNAALAAERANMLEAYGMTEEEYESYMSWLEDAIEQGKSTLSDEEFNQIFDLYGQGQTEDVAGGNQEGAETIERPEGAETDVSQNGERGNDETDAGTAEQPKQPAVETAQQPKAETWEEHVNKAMEAYDKEYAAIEKSDGERLRKEAAGYSDERLLNTYIRNAGISQIFGKGREGMRKFVSEEKNYKADKLDEAKENHLEAAPDAARQSFVQDVLIAELDRRGIEYKEDYTFAETSEAEDWYKKNVGEKSEEKVTKPHTVNGVPIVVGTKMTINGKGEGMTFTVYDVNDNGYGDYGFSAKADNGIRRIGIKYEDLNDVVEDGTIENVVAPAAEQPKAAVGEEAAPKQNIADVEAGGAIVDKLEQMGVEVSADIAENRRVRKQAQNDKSENGKVHELRTTDGKVYGFAYRGKLYLDPRKIDAELPLHEYAHLWTEAMRMLNPKKWAEVVEQIKQDKDAWQFIQSTYPDLKTDSEIADEVIATFSGKNGAEKLKAALDRFTQKNPDYKSRWNAIFNSVAKALQDFWKAVGDFLNIKYESAEQVYDQVLKDFVGGMNPRARVEKYLQERETAYMQAAESGDVAKATEIFNQALSEEIGNGMTPFIAVGRYDRASRIPTLAHKVKSRDPKAIDEVAELIAPIIPNNAVLVPAPSHNGRATDMLDLAKAIAKRTGSEVADVLTSEPRDSQYETKKRGGLIASQDMGITMTGTLPEGKIPVVIDNVVGSGNTAEACVRAIGKGLVVSLGDAADRYNHAVTLKSAAPILRDRNNNIVPLSKRFELGGSQYLGRSAYERADGKAAKVSAKERKLRDAVVDLLRKAGIDVVTESEEGQRVLDMANGRERQHRVYHGSGADFERFDHSHMGEGEGAQAFGWGTYVTEVEGIGRQYAENLPKVWFRDTESGYEVDWKEVRDNWEEGVKRSALLRVYENARGADYNMEKAIENAISEIEGREGYEEELAYLRQLTADNFEIDRNLYTVEIPEDNGSNYIDWTKKPGIRTIRRLVEQMNDKQKERISRIPVRKNQNGEEIIDKNNIAERILWHVNNTGWNNLYDVAEIANGGKYVDNEKSTAMLLHSAGFVGVKYPAEYYSGGRSDGAKNYVIFDEGDLQITDKVKFFRTESGEAYGFSMGGKIYLDPKIATAETPIHEYTHLWAEALRAANPKAWEQLKSELEKDTELVAYVQRLYPELAGSNGANGSNGLSDELAEEVFAHFSGRRGAERLREEQRKAMEGASDYVEKAGVVAMFERLRDALRRFWNMARDLFGGKVAEGKSAEDFADMVLADLVSGFNPSTDSDVRFRGEEEPVFYSNAMRAVENIKQEKATPEQWVKMIEKQGGMKAGEDKWLGLSEWLKGSDAKTLTKGEVLDYIRPKTQSREGGEEAAQGDWYDRGSVERIGEFVGYSPKRIAAMNARQEQTARNKFRNAAEKLHLGDRITFVDTIDEIEGIGEEQRKAWRRKKGWYSPRTGKIVIILGNHKSMDDVMKSILHEGVAHHGLRQMFGVHFDTFLDNVYLLASSEIREKINDMAKKHGWDFRETTEEYLATLAEDTDFEKPENQSWWRQVKAWFIDLLHKIGFRLHDVYDTITDNELRYILWRSYENLVHPGRYNSVVEEAKDVAKQYELKVGRWDVEWTIEDREPDATTVYNGRRIAVWATNGRRGNREDRADRTDRTDMVDRKEWIRAVAEAKRHWPGAMVLEHVGDFYVIHGEDARKVAKVLGLPLVQRSGNDTVGFPAYAVDTYLPKLVRAGERVAVVDSVNEDAVVYGGENIEAEDAAEYAKRRRTAEAIRERFPEPLTMRNYKSWEVKNYLAHILGMGGWINEIHREIPYRFLHPEPTLDDYFKDTKATFESIGKVPEDDTPNKLLAAQRVNMTRWEKMKESGKYEHHQSPLSNSEYLVDRETGDIYRLSDHWGKVASCDWDIDQLHGGERGIMQIGKCNITEFSPKNKNGKNVVMNPAYIKALTEATSVAKENYRTFLDNVEMTDAVRRDVESQITDLEKNLEREIGNYDDSGIRFRDGEDEETIDDLVNSPSIDTDTRYTALAAGIAMYNAQSLEAKTDAIRAVTNNLTRLRSDMAKANRIAREQKKYDKGTVKRVTDLARVMVSAGHLDGTGRADMKELLAAIRESTGNEDNTANVNRIMDIMVKNQLRNMQDNLKKLLSIKGSKVDAKGVNVQGKLDPNGQQVIKAFKDNMKEQESTIKSRIADCEERMTSSDKSVADAAYNERAGLMLALDYLEKIGKSIAAEKDIEAKRREELSKIYDIERVAVTDADGNVMYKKKDGEPMTREVRHIKEEYKNGRNNAERARVEQTVEAMDDAIRHMRMRRIDAYSEFVAQVAGHMKESMKKAEELREAEKRRIEEIHHNANSDMEGRPAEEHRERNKGFGNWLNNLSGSTLFAPLASFTEMMRLFGSKSPNGEGYLFNRFVRGLIDARQKETAGVTEKYSELDEKAKEVFGGKVETWADMMEEVGKGEKLSVEWWDGKAMKPHTLHQGNLMYIYMVNKMSDGRMKLRHMGITDEEVAVIESKLDPRLKEIADWLQEDFLVRSRNEYNATHIRMFGASMAAIEDYFPLVINKDSRSKTEEELDQYEWGEGITTTTGAIKERTVNVVDLDLLNADAMHVILQHIAEMEHWNAFAEYNRDLNTLRTYKRFENQVKNMRTIYGDGQQTWDKFNEVCQIAAGSYRKKYTDADKGALEFATMVTAAKVAFRINTALKQLLSLPAYLPYINAKGFFYSVANNMANKETSFNWCMEHLPIFAERWRSRVSGDPRLARTVMDWQSGRANRLQKIARAGMLPNAFIDALTVSIGAHAVYETRKAQYLREGYSKEAAEKRAIQDAEIAYNETQQSSEGGFVSTFQTDRTWFTVMFSIFRNASMAYQRQLHGALRSIWNMRTKARREEAKEYLAKQIAREGVNEAQATLAAERRFDRAMRKNWIAVATFGYIVQFAWNFGGQMWYMLFGDDDDKKKKTWKDIFVHSLFGGVEGLLGGDVLSELFRQIATGDRNPQSLNKDMPLTSDMVAIIEKAFKGREWEALSDLINLAVQAGVGANPQTLTDAVVAAIDACNGDLGLAREASLFAMRVIQVPQSQTEQLYFDEIEMTGEEARKLSYEQLVERYAKYRVKRNFFWTWWEWDNEKELEKGEKRANRIVRERLEGKDEETLSGMYENDWLKKMVGSITAKRLGEEYGEESVSDSYGSGSALKTKYGKVYANHRDYVDMAEDITLNIEIRQAEEAGDEEQLANLKGAKKFIDKQRKSLVDANGDALTEEDIQERMGWIRKVRRNALNGVEWYQE